MLRGGLGSRQGALKVVACSADVRRRVATIAPDVRFGGKFSGASFALGEVALISAQFI
jgi:hypothetical protein